MGFLFEELEVYKRSMRLVIKVYALCASARVNGNRKLVDQLQRAVLSIPLNIAEGNGRMHVRERKQYFYTARGSLLECVPILRICMEIGLLSEERHNELYQLAIEIGKLLSGLIRSVS